jgi:hypothetical protein
VSVALVVRLTSEGQQWRGLARDLSLEGMFVQLESPLPGHLSRFEAVVTASNTQRHVAAVAEVAHRHPKGIGLRLCLVGGTDFRAWRDLWREALPGIGHGRFESAEPQAGET